MVLVARHTKATKLIQGRPSKFDLKERLLSFLFYVKHNTSCLYEASLWIFSRLCLDDDALFNANTINVAFQ